MTSQGLLVNIRNMLNFYPKKYGFGIEITSSTVRVAVVEKKGPSLSAPFVKSADLPWGMVTESYSVPNIMDLDELTLQVKECLAGAAQFKIRRAALSLPDSIFRVQTLEFDDLPRKTQEQERLVRWRLEKAAAFDTADTVLRYQVLRRQDTGFTVLACVAKRAVLSQYETLLANLGYEPWAIGLSSFHVLNFYASAMKQKSPVFALAHVTGDSFATLISEGGGVRFYRFKELKKGSTDDVRARLMREIEDSLHFYMHRDRSQPSEVGHLYLSGEPAAYDALTRGFTDMESLTVEVLSPSAVLASRSRTGPDSEFPLTLAAALGAGGSL